MNTNNKSRMKDTSQFTRWINNLDEKDKSLNPIIRKGKWGLIVTALLFVFGLSFFGIPGFHIKPKMVKSLFVAKDTIPKSRPSSFELPVDSFANHLKQKLHEELPEEK